MASNLPNAAALPQQSPSNHRAEIAGLLVRKARPSRRIGSSTWSRCH